MTIRFVIMLAAARPQPLPGHLPPPRHQPADGRPDGTGIAGTVGSILKDKKVRENVLRLAKVYAQYNALDTIERLLFG